MRHASCSMCQKALRWSAGPGPLPADARSRLKTGTDDGTAGEGAEATKDAADGGPAATSKDGSEGAATL